MKMKINLNPLTWSQNTRAYMYRILLGVAALAGVYGLATQEEIAGWVGLGIALIGNGVATGNTHIESNGRHEAP